MCVCIYIYIYTVHFDYAIFALIYLGAQGTFKQWLAGWALPRTRRRWMLGIDHAVSQAVHAGNTFTTCRSRLGLGLPMQCGLFCQRETGHTHEHTTRTTPQTTTRRTTPLT